MQLPKLGLWQSQLVHMDVAPLIPIIEQLKKVLTFLSDEIPILLILVVRDACIRYVHHEIPTNPYIQSCSIDELIIKLLLCTTPGHRLN